MKKYWKIFYHGTNKKNAEKILSDGFKRGTYFATHLEDAIGYGGVHIFEVGIKLDYDHTYWEYISKRKISPRQIVKYKVFKKPKIVFSNSLLGDRIFKHNLREIIGRDKFRSYMAKNAWIKRKIL